MLGRLFGRHLSAQLHLLPAMYRASSNARSTRHLPTLFMVASAAVITAAVVDDEFDYQMRVLGNGFANTAMRSGALSQVRSDWFYNQLHDKEGVTPTTNVDGAILFRGEFCFDGEPEAQAARLMKSGRFAPMLAMRELPSGSIVNLSPTMGNPVLINSPDVPANWSAGGVSLTASLDDAKRYAGDDGVIVFAAPARYISMADHSYKNPGREYECVTSALSADEILAVVVVSRGQMEQAYVNESLLASGKSLTADAQLAEFLSSVSNKPYLHAKLSRLSQFVDKQRSFKADYESREADDIYALYARTVKQLIGVYRKRSRASRGLFSQQGASELAKEQFLREKLPSLSGTLSQPAHELQKNSALEVALRQQLVSEFGLSESYAEQAVGKDVSPVDSLDCN